MRKPSEYLIPLPKRIEENGNIIKIASFGGKVAIRLSEKCDLTRSAREVLEKKLAGIACVTGDGVRGDYKLNIKVDPADALFEGIESDEAYYVRTAKRETLLVGKSPAGAFYAAVTFAETLELAEDDVLIPDVFILDYPDFKFRGHTFESRYGTEFLTKEDYLEIVDYLASMKINRLCLTLYDCWGWQYDSDPAEFLYMPVPGHPEIKSPKRIKYYSVREGRWINRCDLIPTIFKEKFLPEVIAYAKKRNIVIIPQINTLGHNRLIPRYIPEISAKHPDGTPKKMGYCTANPATMELIYKWTDYMIDEYIAPFGNDEIHFGLDEVGPAFKCECPKCKDKSRTDIFLDFAIEVIKYSKKRGMKSVFLCHDMFLELDAVTDGNKQRFVDAGVDDVAVLDWWCYEDPTAGLFFGKRDKVRKILRSRIKPYSSYQNWTAAQDTHENVRGMMKVAIEHGFEGTDAYGTFDYSFDKNFYVIADLSWNVGEIDNQDGFDRRYASKYYPKNTGKALTAFRAMRDIMIDEAHNHFQNRFNRWLEYYNFSYRVVKKDEAGNELLDECGNRTFTIKNFPGESFDRLIRSDRVEVAFLELVKKNSDLAIAFFENSGRYDKLNDTWLLTCRHYNRIADEYLSLLNAALDYNNGGSPIGVIETLDRLINEREKLMAFAECAKMRAQSYVYLRNMSLFRQYLVDLRAYLERETLTGRRPRLELSQLDYAMSEKFRFLR